MALTLAGFPSPYFNVHFEVLHEKRVMETPNFEEKSNPNQTHLKKLINVFKIIIKLQAGVFD